ncbi:MAG: translation initiation factor IF-3 [Waddliaceae bacterium]|nr:translation initiation factor IF-3 [Waddliaceae bacterium]
MRVNKEIRARSVRVINDNGDQLGIMSVDDALAAARTEGVDLVEIAPKANPPVCKITDYGKWRYALAKKERENKKAQHQTKVKEVKLKPNIDEHDFQVKAKRARSFLEKGNKVKVTCMFRGREMAHPEIGRRVVKKLCEDLADVSIPEAMPKQMGRFLTLVLAPVSQKKKPVKQSTAEEPESV